MKFKVWVFDGIDSKNGTGFAFTDTPPYVDILVGSLDSQVYSARIGCGADSMEWLRKELKRVADSGSVTLETYQTIWDTFVSKAFLLYFSQVRTFEHLTKLGQKLYPTQSSQ